MYSAILIAGPTASGKSALAIRLAEQIGGRVVNADSMQVYADLRVLTARPTPEDETHAPHRLFGHVDGAENYSVGKWLADARRELDAARADGLTPVFAGGTGLYFKALTQGLSDIPPVPDDVRARVRGEAEGVAPDVLHARLAACDPASAARLRPSDPQRILRALEVFAATGASLTAFQGARRAPLLDASQCLCLFLAPERAALTARIDARFEAMMDEGALDEVSRLATRGLDAALPIMRAHGAPGLMAFLRGEISREEAVARGQRDTRAYARRQFTFARHQLPGFRWLDLREAASYSL
jgi:tRNA dimethylallyltransferase